MKTRHGRRWQIIGVVVVLTLLAASTLGSGYRYAVGGGGGLVSLEGGNYFKFGSQKSIGFSLRHRLTESWQLDLEYSSYTLYNDQTAALIDSVGNLANNSAIELKATRLGMLFDRNLWHFRKSWNLTVGGGGGLMVWKAINPASNTTYTVRSEKNETTDFSATELFLTGVAGMVVRPSSRLSLHLVGRVDFFTGAGAEFENAVKDIRDNLLLGAQAKLYFHFGEVVSRGDWRSDKAWTESPGAIAGPRQARRDSDGDGVEDRLDQCLNTPRGAKVDAQGCPIDSDRDGIPDGVDDCPGTMAEARALVDIHGCPVDSDFDGVPDWADNCAHNPIGAIVDTDGCPIDSDNDGVPNGLDDCPHTLIGVEVDRHGCIDLSMLARPMVLNIDYAPGSFEVDPHNRKRLERLAGLLNFVSDIKLDINGYTDNIGAASANLGLAKKRANRVRGILEVGGVASERIKVFGRGEVDFVASNQTADGRARNRRIEIVFYR